MTGAAGPGSAHGTPVQSVKAAIEGGAGTLAGIARVTGLDPDVVDAVVEHLTRSGALRATTLAIGCPDGGCGSCASGGPGAAAACGAAAPSPERRGSVLVALSLRAPQR